MVVGCRCASMAAAAQVTCPGGAVRRICVSRHEHDLPCDPALEEVGEGPARLCQRVGTGLGRVQAAGGDEVEGLTDELTVLLGVLEGPAAPVDAHDGAV